MKYEVILTESAKEELEDIFYYILKKLKAKKAAENFINKIERKILILEDIPNSYCIIDQCKLRKPKYRKLPINNYIVIYRVDEANKKVYIIRIVYKGRNYLKEI
ncbi:MAG: type II toxin-antitoxin system RelE/ParE family toxin [Clostridia bacterium]|nr:type II toxin-antitoxin system RelE/ParE family toxin [Clostridia bacterium]